MRKTWLSLVFTVLLPFLVKAATVDTINIYSDAMHKASKCIVIRPDSYRKKNNVYPVVYLLHGHSGAYSDWITRVPGIIGNADLLQLIIVCPDGGPSSWYFDSPIDSSMKYETYIGTEVPRYIDAHYHTIATREGRAITGLSMGGHGAFFLAIRHPGTFGACGSMSGGVDLYASRTRFDIVKKIGDTLAHAQNWIDYSVIHLIDHMPTQPLAIFFDCGMDDIFFEGNHALHEKMLRLKIPHDYTERPGEHNWAYWGNAVGYQLLFFRKFFDRQVKK
jgi:S-formylglutathione hydrolase FrmB